MRSITLGSGKPEIAVVAGIHGDEPAGVKAIEKIIESDLHVKKPVKLVIANEEALNRGKRYLDSDLNRSFPGDISSDLHEEKLAAELLEEVQNCKVLDLHTTHSYDRPFATVKDISSSVEMVKAANADKAVYFPEDSGILTEFVDGIVLEAGLQGSKQAAENALRSVKNFLAYYGAINEDYELSSPEFFKYYDTVEGDWVFLADNFEKVEVGEVYAKTKDEELKASESFYPVLMSTNGYNGILGYKADKVEED